MDIEQARFNMIEQQIRPWDVLNQDILNLLHVVKRENFVPPIYKDLAFSDTEIPLPHGQHMFTPKLEARILQELAIKKQANVLEIGTGSGYMAALLASKSRFVLSIEIHSEIATLAKENLHRNQIHNVEVIVGDGSLGWRDNNKITAPYDIIVVSGALATLPDSFLKQLKIGGKLFVINGEAPIMTAKLITRTSSITFHTLALFETCVDALHAPASSHFNF
jgi:protein-L-isoaspartate(D-aspartate) O-methyltransferase